MTPLVYVIHALVAIIFVALVAQAHALGRAAARRRASLEPVVLLPRAIGIPSAHRKRIGWWM